MSISFSGALAALLLLTGCAAAPMPSFPVTHPANPAAAETPPSVIPILAMDEESTRTEKLLNH